MTNKIKLEDTGERLIPEYHKTGAVWGSVYGEHVVRYEATTPLVKDKVVLDIACGSGYGSAILAESAQKVIGVDVDKTTVDYATQNYGSKNIEFLVGDAIKIPVPDASVDVVVTYETIEHIADYKKFMAEIKRVLKPDGLAIISTPNDKEFMKGNHFHIHQFEYVELKKLIKGYFSHQKAYFQGDWVCNAIVNEQELSQEWRREVQVINLSPKRIDQSTYFFILCSNRPVIETVAPLLGMSEHWSYRATQEDKQDQTELIEKLTKNASLIEVEKAHLADKVDVLSLDLGNSKTEIKNIKNSRTWKAASKMARVSRLLKRQK